jgi:hypothetical protein
VHTLHTFTTFLTPLFDSFSLANQATMLLFIIMSSFNLIVLLCYITNKKATKGVSLIIENFVILILFILLNIGSKARKLVARVRIRDFGRILAIFFVHTFKGSCKYGTIWRRNCEFKTRVTYFNSNG